MKKGIAILAALTILFSAAALAENLAEMTDEELIELHRDVESEMARRGLPDDPEEDSEQHAAADRVTTFFIYWSRDDLDNMLTGLHSLPKIARSPLQSSILKQTVLLMP